MVQARVWSITAEAAMTPCNFKLLQAEFPSWHLHQLPNGKIGARPPKWADWNRLGERIRELSGQRAAKAGRRQS